MTERTLIDIYKSEYPEARGSTKRMNGPCPFCGGDTNSNRFTVWSEGGGIHGGGHYLCWACDAKGDAIQYLREVNHMSFTDAKAELGIVDNIIPKAKDGHSKHKRVTSIQTDSEPAHLNDKWQEVGAQLWSEAIDHLWASEGERALSYLNKRGLRNETLQRFGVGYNPEDLRFDSERFGLTGGQVWVPRGITIPNISGVIRPVIHNIRIRRPTGKPKYFGLKGSGNGLWNVDELSPVLPTVLTEAEFDAMVVWQEAYGYVVPVATGGVTMARLARYKALMAACPVVLLAFDNDEAGRKATDYWLTALRNAIRWPPTNGKDINEMLLSGESVKDWVLVGLENAPF